MRTGGVRVSMRIDVKDQGVNVGDGLRNYVGLRLMSVLDHLERRVGGVTVYLTDVHAREGGVDKRCRMLAHLAPSGEVRVEETGPGIYAAIDRTAERLALELARRETTAAARTARAVARATERRPRTSRRREMRGAKEAGE